MASTENYYHTQLSLEELERDLSPSRWSNRFDNPNDVLAAYIHNTYSGTEKARKTFESDIGIPYGKGDYRKLDIFGLKSLPDDSPILVYLHGGYWQHGGRELSGFQANMAVPQGVVLAAVGYDIAPYAKMQDICESVMAALQYICEITSTGQNQRQRDVYIVGHSAGAHLAAITTLTELNFNRTCLDSCLATRMKGLILVAGVYDLQPIVPTYINSPLGLTSTQAKTYSPQLARVSNDWVGTDKEVLVAYPENDAAILKEQSITFFEKIKQAGVNCKLSRVSGVDHFSIIENTVAADFSLSKLALEKRYPHSSGSRHLLDCLFFTKTTFLLLTQRFTKPYTKTRTLAVAEVLMCQWFAMVKEVSTKCLILVTLCVYFTIALKSACVLPTEYNSADVDSYITCLTGGTLISFKEDDGLLLRGMFHKHKTPEPEDTDAPLTYQLPRFGKFLYRLRNSRIPANSNTFRYGKRRSLLKFFGK